MAYGLGNEAQPATRSGKAQVAHEAMGGDGSAPRNLSKPPKSRGKFHGMDIESASNGVQINHRVKHFKKTEDQQGASDHPTFEDMKTSKHVLTDDHPMMAHVRALDQYCQDCNED
jgi:hypothetical protein